MSKYQKSLFIFRRDLRLQDNTALIEALRSSEEVIPIFVLDDRQTKAHPFRSDFGLQFMLLSLQDLDASLQKKKVGLQLFVGVAEQVIEKLLDTQKIEAVYFNQDYTPFSRKRDEVIASICQKKGVDCFALHDALLQAPGVVTKDDGLPYTIYTPFMKKSSLVAVSEPRKNTAKNYFQGELPDSSIEHLNALLNDDFQGLHKGGRKEALKTLKRIGDFDQYDVERDIPSVPGTTGLSPHLKFGTVSAREVYACVAEEFGRTHTLIRELYWRDFFTCIGFHFPHVFKKPFRPVYEGIVWNKEKKRFKKWCDGNTGFPIVDAGMRELNETGFMHNRVRMITASFLVKDLHINWQWGERYFATKLVDYDPAVNNGNWQWAASTGCDAQPYFRIFNPWRQQQRFDPNCTYIKKWVPELREMEAKAIHKLEAGPGLFSSISYPSPMVVHKEASAIAKDMYKSVRESAS